MLIAIRSDFWKVVHLSSLLFSVSNAILLLVLAVTIGTAGVGSSKEPQSSEVRAGDDGSNLEVGIASSSMAKDALSDEWAAWLNAEGRRFWGEPPKPCHDLLHLRRLYLDLLGRVPSVSEIRDYLAMDVSIRRKVIVDQLVFHQGSRGDDYRRSFATNWGRHWRSVMIASASQNEAITAPLESWLSKQFAGDDGFDTVMSSLVELKGSGLGSEYFRLSQSSPATYAANLSRVLLGVRLECTQCHDHPFTDWKQEDFWGIAAFYSDLNNNTQTATSRVAGAGVIEVDGVTYTSKVLWAEPDKKITTRSELASWLTSSTNVQFAPVAVNRYWQHLVGRGIFLAVDDLDTATPSQRVLLDALATKFATEKFPIRSLVAAICKSDWYQAIAMESDSVEQVVSNSVSDFKSIDKTSGDGFTSSFQRPFKTLSPEQVFDSLEQALILPISRLDPSAARWNSERSQVVSRLNESASKSPDEYTSGIPQALVMMNGRITADAMNLDSSRLLRAVLESPFMSDADRIESLFLATLSRFPTTAELDAFGSYVRQHAGKDEKQRAHGEILWALVNSPEFVLCR